MLRDRVLLLLAAVGVAGAAALPFVAHAPNRLLSGVPVAFGTVFADGGLLILGPAAVLLVAAWLPARRPYQLLVVGAAVVFMAGIVWLAGAHAALLARTGSPIARTSLASGFWVVLLAAALMLAEMLHRLALSPAARIVAGLGAALPIVALVVSGALGHLSLLQEYANRRDVFEEALLRHIEIVLATMLPTLALGVPLGMLAQRRAAWRAPVFSVLNVVQTIPSIALFGLLLEPLADLARAVPALGRIGIGGIGLAPTIIALTLYSLLPLARNVTAALDDVPADVLEAARGMGMTSGQILWRVELWLALPIFLSGLRITIVQAIGLTVVAALIGAGGLGAIMFQGLFANALDLVMLGVLPVVLMAVAVDAGMKLLVSLAARHAA
jgi:osmoprotectant transport system permease protein